MRFLLSASLSLALFMCSSLALAQDTPSDDEDRDAAIFGEEEPETKEDKTDEETSSTSRDDDIFNDSSSEENNTNASDSETRDAQDVIEAKIAKADNELALGGFLFMQFGFTAPGLLSEDDKPKPNDPNHVERLSAPTLVDLYLDARPAPDVRAYIRGRLNYDLTVNPNPQAPQENPFSFLSSGSPGGLGAFRSQEQLTALLDQLWLKFNISQTLFITVGRQRIRWGASRFFNPTDFLNAAQIDPIALFDRRLGVDMVKLHLPIETYGWNFYLIGLLGQSQTLEDIGGAFRGEFLLWDAELAVSFMARKQPHPGPNAIPNPINDRLFLWEPTQDWSVYENNIPLRFGMDLTGPVGPIDLRLEAAMTYGQNQPFYRGKFSFKENPGNPLDLIESFPTDYSRAEELILQATVSMEWMHKYNDEDIFILSAEYFYNGAGYESSDLYLWLILQQSFQPLALGQHYLAAGLALPSPGSLDDLTFLFSTIANLSDQSALSRIDITASLFGELSVSLSGMLFWGNVGEFRFGFRVPNPTMPDEPVVLHPSLYNLALSLRMGF